MITVWVPASSANLGPGYDALGLALDFGLEVTLEETPSGLDIRVEGDGQEEIARDDSNLIVRAAERVFDLVRQGRATGAGAHVPKGLRLFIRNGIPITRGLGSSAAAIVAGLLAADRLSGANLGLEALVSLGTEMEGHPDNIVPSFFGGITVAVWEDGRVYHQSIRPPEALLLVLAVPDFHVPTEEARKRVPTQVSLQDAVHNLGRSSLLVASLASGSWDLLRVAMRDRLHQPYRRPLVPGLEEALAAAETAGAAGAALSGSGPSVLAVVPGGSGAQAEAEGTASRVGQAMADAFRGRQVSCQVLVTRIAPWGALVTSDKMMARRTFTAGPLVRVPKLVV